MSDQVEIDFFMKLANFKSKMTVHVKNWSEMAIGEVLLIKICQFYRCQKSEVLLRVPAGFSFGFGFIRVPKNQKYSGSGFSGFEKCLKIGFDSGSGLEKLL